MIFSQRKDVANTALYTSRRDERNMYLAPADAGEVDRVPVRGVTHCERAVQVLHGHFTHCEKAVQVLHDHFTHCEKVAKGCMVVSHTATTLCRCCIVPPHTVKGLCRCCMVILHIVKRPCRCCMVILHTVKRPRRCCIVILHTVPAPRRCCTLISHTATGFSTMNQVVIDFKGCPQSQPCPPKKKDSPNLSLTQNRVATQGNPRIHFPAALSGWISTPSRARALRLSV